MRLRARVREGFELLPVTTYAFIFARRLTRAKALETLGPETFPARQTDAPKSGA